MENQFLQFAVLSRKKMDLMETLVRRGELTPELKIKILTLPDFSSLKILAESCGELCPSSSEIARKKSLEPLALRLWRQLKTDPCEDAFDFIDPRQNINSFDDALKGAREIISEWLRDDVHIKEEIKTLLGLHGTLDWDHVNKDHPEWPRFKKYLPLPPVMLTQRIDHLYKILEAEAKGILSFSVNLRPKKSLEFLQEKLIKNDYPSSLQLRVAFLVSYERFLQPAVEIEIRRELLNRALSQTEVLKALPPAVRPFALDTRFLVLAFLVLLVGAFLTLRSTRQLVVPGTRAAKEALRDDVSDGIKKQYYPDGRLKSIKSYLNGKPDGGFREFRPNGQISSLVTYKNGMQNGESREYYDNGEMKSIKHFKEGKLEGVAQEFDKDGRQLSEHYYHKGEVIKIAKEK